MLKEILPKHCNLIGAHATAQNEGNENQQARNTSMEKLIFKIVEKATANPTEVCLGLPGHLITNLPQAMLLPIKISL